MAEAAKKEPSMEDILSSIRKIIAEEGATEQSEVIATAPASSVEDPALETSGGIGIGMEADAAAESAKLHDTQLDTAMPDLHAQAIETTSTMVSEMPVATEAPAHAPEANASASLAAIAAGIQGAAQAASEETMVSEELEAPIATPEPETLTELPAASTERMVQEEQQIHVEMADAVQAPSTDVEMTAVAAPTEQDMAREEEAFRGALMSPSADHAVAGAFDRLKRSAMDDIEATTEAILRPMLREWLDENLPTLVEKLVREEIERVARGS